MPQKQTNQLPDGGAVQDTDVLPADRAASPWVTVKLSALALYTYILTKLTTANRAVPLVGVNPNGYVLRIVSGVPAWFGISELPDNGSASDGEVVRLVAGTPAWSATSEVPAPDSPEDDGKVLTASSGVFSWQTPSGGTTYRQTLSATRRT